jgi:signal transduction histidine kinase
MLRKPSGPTLITLVLLIVLPALAVLQYRWLGQVSVAERERMQRNVRNAADQFREAFDREFERASFFLQVGPNTAREGTSDLYSDRYNQWINTANYPQIVADIFLLDAVDGQLRLRRWNTDTHVFESASWTPRLQMLRPQFERALAEFQEQPRFVDTRNPAFRGDDSMVVLGPRGLFVRGADGRMVPSPDPVFTFTVIQLDMASMEGVLLEELARTHFRDAEGDSYRVAVTVFDDPTRILYRSDAAAPVDPALADATAPLLRPRGRAQPPAPTRGPDAANTPRVETEDRGRWRLLVQHETGSLEAAVSLSRRRNLAISFGILLLLSGSVGMLAVTSRKAERLAQQQMEFVAGVSHELRTPVAVIRSASENLAQGVVSGDRVKRYGQLLEGEARRLGEMVERVLQYAGIESGLGFGSRAPLAPSEIIESAIESAIPMVGPDVTVQRDIPADLPPVLGDAAALRSAVQNLIANAVKYGGRDRWVGIKAQHVRERRHAEVRIIVSDHGPGIPASELPHIFDPFYRGADAIERQIHGNGLGLSLVKRIVSAHGGRVNVTTKTGAGSAFTITLPAAEADSQASAVSNEVRVGAHT